MITGSPSVPKHLFYFRQEIIFLSPAYFYFHTVAHKNHASFTPLIFCYPNGLYSLCYAEFVVPLVKAVQEQQTLIESQQKQIDELRKAIEELKQARK